MAKGIKILRSKGIKVDVGIRKSECLQLNEHYIKFVKTGMPYRNSSSMPRRWMEESPLSSGDSQWISSEASRRLRPSPPRYK